MKLWKAALAAAAMTLGTGQAWAADFTISPGDAGTAYGRWLISEFDNQTSPAYTLTLEWTAEALSPGPVDYTILFQFEQSVPGACGPVPYCPPVTFRRLFNLTAPTDATVQRLDFTGTYQFGGLSGFLTVSTAQPDGQVRFTDFRATRNQISNVGVPEPATWGLMVLGLGVIGAAVRRRRAEPVPA